MIYLDVIDGWSPSERLPGLGVRLRHARLLPEAGVEPLGRLQLRLVVGGVPPDPGHLELRRLVEQVLAHVAVLSRSVTASVRIESGNRATRGKSPGGVVAAGSFGVMTLVLMLWLETDSPVTVWSSSTLPAVS